MYFAKDGHYLKVTVEYALHLLRLTLSPIENALVDYTHVV